MQVNRSRGWTTSWSNPSSPEKEHWFGARDPRLIKLSMIESWGFKSKKSLHQDALVIPTNLLPWPSHVNVCNQTRTWLFLLPMHSTLATMLISFGFLSFPACKITLVAAPVFPVDTKSIKRTRTSVSGEYTSTCLYVEEEREWHSNNGIWVSASSRLWVVKS